MTAARLSKLLTITVAALLLSGCLYLQLGGGISRATVTVTPLREPTDVIQQLQSPSLDELRAFSGSDNWDSFEDLARLLFFGITFLDRDFYDDSDLYLVTAAGGLEHDSDSDGSVDSTASIVGGQWHAILTGAQLRRGVVTPLTDVVYRSLELQLDELSDADILLQLELAAERLVPDLDESGDVDYDDVLTWNRQYNATSFFGALSLLDDYSAAVRKNATASTLRELSQTILGDPPAAGSLFQISGQVSVTYNTRVDSDVNDPQAQYADNNSLNSAQELINPVVVGGYSNVPRAGEGGASFTAGDEDDYFRANLLAGQLITLVMADDPGQNDLDLYLYDADGELIEASLGLSELEQISIPADGTYSIAVRTFIGASNYRLTLGLGELPTQTERILLSQPFVPGDIIATFSGDPSVQDSLDRRERLTGMRVRGGLRRENLLRIPAHEMQGKRLRQKKLRTLLRLKSLRRQSDVSSADLNFYVQASAVPNDVYYNQQSWHYEMINLPSAWNQAQGEGTIVAVIDTGVLQDHQDLEGQLLPGYDFVSDTETAADGDGIDPDPHDPGDSTGTTRSSFHGTHVAGTIAAASNNVRGVSGIAWEAQLMPLRVLGAGGGTTYDVLQAVRYAAGLPNDSGSLPQQPADIINLSLSGGGFTSTAQNLYSQVSALGVIVVAAAGNESSGSFAYPASYEDVISVSAVNINRERADYSNFGSRIDIAAPGGDSTTRDVNGDGIADMILSTSGDDSSAPTRNTYELLQGTSMAAPHVSGVLALMKSVYPDLDSTDLRSLLQQGLISDDLGSEGRDNLFGYGLINANRAMLAARSLASGEDLLNLPSIAVSTSALNFGAILDELPLALSNGGTGELKIDSVISNASWLVVDDSLVDAQGLGQYRIRVERNQLSIGSHSATLSISSNAGSSNVHIILQQPDPNQLASGDAGLHYILLVNADSGEVEQEALILAEGGQYQYSFQDVPPGNYQLYAGSDSDNDFFICDAGEACGAWPVLDSQPAVIQLRQDLLDMDFSTTFNTGIISASQTGSKPSGHSRSRYVKPGNSSEALPDGAASQESRRLNAADSSSFR